MGQPNFEAIGRYQVAREQVRRLTVERSTLLQVLTRVAETPLAHHIDECFVPRLNIEQMLMEVERLRALESELAVAVAEANRWARSAAAPELRRSYAARVSA